MTAPKPAGLHLDLDWRTTLLTVLLLPALIGLGVWQLQRADEKADIDERWEQRRQQAAVAIGSVDPTDTQSLQYLPVKLHGTFLPGKYFLLDNRVYRGKFGNEVLAVMALDSGGAVLVNRGWIAADASRRSLPEVPEAEGHLTVAGHVYVSPGKPYLLADVGLEPGWPKRIQAIEMDKLAPALGKVAPSPLFPYAVRIDSGQAGALTVDWQVINVSPEKHTGYAVQWFTMAFALFILFILRSSNLWQLLRGNNRNK